MRTHGVNYRTSNNSDYHENHRANRGTLILLIDNYSYPGNQSTYYTDTYTNSLYR